MLIDTIFYPFEASIIKAIPLSFRRPDDSLIWTRNKSGTFTLRSAYLLQTKLERDLKEIQASSSIHLDFTLFGMVFGPPRFHLRSKHLFGNLGDHILCYLFFRCFA